MHNTLTDGLMEDRRNADMIASQVGLHLFDDPPKDQHLERMIWMLAVAVLHITTWILRREGKG